MISAKSIIFRSPPYCLPAAGGAVVDAGGGATAVVDTGGFAAAVVDTGGGAAGVVLGGAGAAVVDTGGGATVVADGEGVVWAHETITAVITTMRKIANNLLFTLDTPYSCLFL